MLPFERQNKIIEQLENGIVFITDLAKSLDVSEITIRRDLKALESEGKLVLLHGGAAKKIDTSRETAISQRQGLYPTEKEKIGKIAANVVEDGDVIFIDSGTTNVTMIKHLANKDISIVTNGFKTIEEALKYDIPITSIGGELKKETMAFVGAITSRVLNMYTFDKCFLGANGIDKEFGFSNADPNESLIKEQVIKRTQKAYILADHSKFNARSVFKFSDLDNATVITDQVPEDFKDITNVIVEE
ncbi:DeoR/GlpR family DNA-binding transcription regulator [Fundicoccus culcitae]|uniref:DeoR/GlpR family DNA-binding transcription regulator n=1 Tax=Fundicoccus culcitae TaxID=2969821 RepID=A0ABY5P953_9LACT|nr:DeoR/GlpR family DNA-binding transcription regulator [Fundicoccus culcitae]UUX35125.1 DeoR/GlpR family DNA-binding transcription regulator [Fundicoccus culcitae]